MSVQQPRKRGRQVSETVHATLVRHCEMCQNPRLSIPSFDNKRFQVGDRVRVTVTKLPKARRHAE